MAEIRITGPDIADREPKPRASFQILFDPEQAGWLHATLLNQPEVTLYDGNFIEPFDALKVVVIRNQNQLGAIALLNIDQSNAEGFSRSPIGSEEMLALMLKRYPESQVSEDEQRLIVAKKGQIIGAIARINEHQLMIQMGGQVGSIELSEDSPLNDLTIGINQFALFVQRYVSSIWQALPESRDRQMRLTLDLSQIPEGAPASYFSTFEIIGREFRTHHREVDLQTEIGGFQDLKDACKALILDMTDPEKSRGFGTQPHSNRFILITGDEGTGKSLFPKGLDTELRRIFDKDYEHFRLPMADIIQKYGTYSQVIVETILKHVKENEKAAVTTALHLDQLEALCPPDNQAAYMVYIQMAMPVIRALRDFGNELGPASHYVLVIGESRAPRTTLPEGIQKTFRRTFSLKPTRADLADALRVQIETTRKFAQKTGIDPVDHMVDADLAGVIQSPDGLTGRDIQQAILNITSRNKASAQDPENIKITPKDIRNELVSIQISKGLEAGRIRKMGFETRN